MCATGNPDFTRAMNKKALGSDYPNVNLRLPSLQVLLYLSWLLSYTEEAMFEPIQERLENLKERALTLGRFL